MIDVEFGIVVALAAGIGLCIYLTACFRKRAAPPIDKVVEALGFGAAIAIGARMAWAAFDARLLCSILDEHHKIVEDPHLHLTFGEHSFEVFVGGVCIILASIYSLGWLCHRPSHH